MLHIVTSSLRDSFTLTVRAFKEFVKIEEI